MARRALTTRKRKASRLRTIIVAAVAAAVSFVVVPWVIAHATKPPAPRLPAPFAARVTIPAREGMALSGSTNVPRHVRSLLNIRTPLRHGQYVWDETDVATGTYWARVDVKTQTMSIFRGEHEIGTAIVLYGANEKPTPAGTFAILDKRREHRSSLYDAEMPYMLRLTNDGVAIHGVDVRANFATHGCIGVPLEFAKRLFDRLKVGDEVDVIA